MTEIRYPYRLRLVKYMGKALKDTRKKKKMTQGELADITGTSVKFISDVERGKETIQMDKVFDLARALGLLIYVTPDPLSSRSENEE
ncbi:helix-turn-helix domain-containing protein [Desulfobacula sp.]|uniref:helix-turn-helix domain-containing protein n=1 Tax=Desulfobacula sp. TaxID=2593537 RepID=UPI0026314D5F|nr:helix-turn-helix domain-containing protein [Desulfobacula sp.]